MIQSFRKIIHLIIVLQQKIPKICWIREKLQKKVSLYYVDAKPWFVYNETDGLYYRYEFGDKQIDGSTGEQLAVKNIILQNCYSSLKDSKNGTLDIDYLSGGSGMYITNGKAVPITWKKIIRK